MKIKIPLLSSLSILCSLNNTYAADISVKGLVDLRVHQTKNSSDNSYLTGGYGKFRYNDSGLSIGQLALQAELEINKTWSSTLVLNAFADKGHSSIGYTEAYFKYKGLPTSNGWRVSSKIGIFYPNISLENIATAWSSPYMLTSSTINNWVGEELRHTGLNFAVDKLGKFTNSKHTFSADISLFQNNDTAGTLLAWHGWTIGSRQTLLHEKIAIQPFPARQNSLSAQAPLSDPFKEIDHKFGIHSTLGWKYSNKIKASFGYYNNNTDEGLVERGQYTWKTDFYHLGIKYRLAQQWEIITQHMQGSTFMRSPELVKVVDVDFDSSFVMLRHFWNDHHFALRGEYFTVDDLDNLEGDNNNETGRAISLAYRYKLNKQSFVLVEQSWIDSKRPSRWYVNKPIEQTEKQVQIGFRYYF
ncbi:hypothetical protein [Thalassotalea marina]|uniref:Porin n=1 Tax=Thalassotalea marina TaxID=1673741 RepID=A0A919EKV5_9GAMM|nr:hypothetical protein [Thalassotalea marina]GHF91867.1 hypothetical protein GCM10017161_19740 [Thalassotalea marina]